jgi:hypothetical protein
MGADGHANRLESVRRREAGLAMKRSQDHPEESRRRRSPLEFLAELRYQEIRLLVAATRRRRRKGGAKPLEPATEEEPAASDMHEAAESSEDPT